MSGFFSRSSSRRRYPDPNMRGTHYRKKGLFGMFSGLGSGSGSWSSRGYRRQGYPDQSSFQPSSPSAGGQAVCPRCGASVPAGSKFCLSCGEKMTSNAAFCQNCGRPIPPGAKFCPECGAPAQR